MKDNEETRRLTVDKREIFDFPKLPSVISFIGGMLHEIANPPIRLVGFKR